MNAKQVLFTSMIIIFLAVTVQGALALTQVYPAQNSGACSIISQGNHYTDVDCDGVHDLLDNCPNIPNPQQRDSNRNTVGDLCDALVESIHIQTQNTLRASEFFTVSVTLLNYRASKLFDVQIEIDNEDLDIHAQTMLPIVSQGHKETVQFIMQVPRCAKERKHTLQITLRYMIHGVSVVETAQDAIRVLPGGLCDESRTFLENTRIETLFERDVDVAGSTRIPIVITNLNKEQLTYKLSLEGVQDFATYRVDPASVLTVPAGSNQHAYITLEVDPQAPLGMVPITAVVQTTSKSGDIEREAFALQLFIRDPTRAQSDVKLKKIFEIVIILVLFGLLVSGLLIAYKKINQEYPRTTQGQVAHDVPTVLESAGVSHVDTPQEPQAIAQSFANASANTTTTQAKANAPKVTSTPITTPKAKAAKKQVKK